jgi:hypothetical protein
MHPTASCDHSVYVYTASIATVIRSAPSSDMSIVTQHSVQLSMVRRKSNHKYMTAGPYKLHANVGLPTETGQLSYGVAE